MEYIELNHFTLLFCRGRQRNVQSSKRTYKAIVFPLSGGALVAVARRGLRKLPNMYAQRTYLPLMMT